MVERTLGKGEVESSILSSSTISQWLRQAALSQYAMSMENGVPSGRSVGPPQASQSSLARLPSALTAPASPPLAITTPARQSTPQANEESPCAT